MTSNVSVLPSFFHIYLDQLNAEIVYMLCYEIQPGQESERMVYSAEYGIGAGPISADIDPEIRFAIPNEKELRQARSKDKACCNKEVRKIAFLGDGAEPTFPTELPFKAPGMQWNGSPSITMRQLNQQREGMIGRVMNNSTADSAKTI